MPYYADGERVSSRIGSGQFSNKFDSVKAGYTFTDPNMIGEVDEYFYHGDHISSVILVTDKKAKVVQQFAYMPFGELLVDNSTVDLDYRFSAKETDRESGLGYFGARYYDNTSAMWLGVDPLWEKYAGMNPYNYCAGNPVMLVDPDGRNPVFVGGGILVVGSKLLGKALQYWGKSRDVKTIGFALDHPYVALRTGDCINGYERLPWLSTYAGNFQANL